MSDGKVKLDLLDINGLKESVKLLFTTLNKAAEKGVYTIDDAYLAKIACSNMDKCVATLDVYQNFVTELKKREDAMILARQEAAQVEKEVHQDQPHVRFEDNIEEKELST